MATSRKFFAVLESGNTGADKVLQFPDYECAEIACDIWKTAHPSLRAWVRQNRHMQHPDLGRSVMTVEIEV